ncbi:hypothetical protein PQX77_015876 [Marasmius sp. AFHP31]|nr:hypothetical protein PQX77_015876 [Marasmius sp. AFHP31]
MSFSDLRTKKDKKSYVNVSTVPRAQPESSAANSSQSPVVGQENENDSRVREGLYSALPEWLEIRVSPEEGRGIFTKQALRAVISIAVVQLAQHKKKPRVACAGARSVGSFDTATPNAKQPTGRSTNSNVLPCKDGFKQLKASIGHLAMR